MTTTVITGANKGIGRSVARQLAEAGQTVYLGARDRERGESAATDLGVRFLHIDVTDQVSVDQAVERLSNEVGAVDVLVNNAGIAGSMIPSETVTAKEIREVYEVNVFGVVRVIHAMLPLLRASEHPVVVNVASGLGSLTLASDLPPGEGQFPLLSYASSKSALLAITVQYAKVLQDIKVNAADPGFTATDLNGFLGTQTVDQGAEIVVRLATIGPDGPTGTFQSSQGPVPW